MLCTVGTQQDYIDVATNSSGCTALNFTSDFDADFTDVSSNLYTLGDRLCAMANLTTILVTYTFPFLRQLCACTDHPANVTIVVSGEYLKDYLIPCTHVTITPVDGIPAVSFRDMQPLAFIFPFEDTEPTELWEFYPNSRDKLYIFQVSEYCAWAPVRSGYLGSFTVPNLNTAGTNEIVYWSDPKLCVFETRYVYEGRIHLDLRTSDSENIPLEIWEFYVPIYTSVWRSILSSEALQDKPLRVYTPECEVFAWWFFPAIRARDQVEVVTSECALNRLMSPKYSILLASKIPVNLTVTLADSTPTDVFTRDQLAWLFQLPAVPHLFMNGSFGVIHPCLPRGNAIKAYTVLNSYQTSRLEPGCLGSGPRLLANFSGTNLSGVLPASWILNTQISTLVVVGQSVNSVENPASNLSKELYTFRTSGVTATIILTNNPLTGRLPLALCMPSQLTWELDPGYHPCGHWGYVGLGIAVGLAILAGVILGVIKHKPTIKQSPKIAYRIL